MARDTAALLTAAAHGPLNAWAFVAPSDFGVGLWARDALHAGQALGRRLGHEELRLHAPIALRQGDAAQAARRLRKFQGWL